MTYYTAPNGGGVLATGSAAFVNKLSDAPRIYSNVIVPAIPGTTDVLTRVMHNVFSVFGRGPASAVQPSVANWQQFY